MKKWIILAVAGVLVLSGTAYAGLQYHRQQQWKSAYAEALDAFKSAYDYREAGALVFEPRWKDFEAADDKQRRMSLVNYKTQSAAEILHVCGDELKGYRSASDASIQRSVDKDMQDCLAAR